MKNLLKIAAIVPLAAATSACIGGANTVRYMKDKAPVPSLVAIMPPTNNSSDGAAPDTVRRAASEMLLGLGMVPVVSPAQDEQLYGSGEGEHALAELEPKKIAKALGVDGLLYITIDQFHDLNAVVYAERVVGATMKLLDKNGDKVWEIAGTGYNRSVSASPTDWALNAGKMVSNASHIDVQGRLERMLNIHLLDEAQMMCGFMSPNLPSWPQSDKAGVDLTVPPPSTPEAGAAQGVASEKLPSPKPSPK